MNKKWLTSCWRQRSFPCACGSWRRAASSQKRYLHSQSLWFIVRFLVYLQLLVNRRPGYNCFVSAGCNVHSAEDPAGWHGPGLHLPDLRAILSRRHDPGEDKTRYLVECNGGNLIFVLIVGFCLLIGRLLQGKMVLQLSKEPSARLLKHVVRCYLRLSDNSRWPAVPQFILTSFW